jgi:hypothetical protein
VVAFTIFAYYRGIAYLDVFAAPRFLRGDWTTYIVSSNYLRTSPLFTLPIAKVPDYIAPVGTNLAMTDSLPVISPIHRAVLAIWPDRAVQLIGWEMLMAVALTFLLVAHFLDTVTEVDLAPLPREGLTLALATIVTTAPFWGAQAIHPALMQQWILVWALAGALRRCPSVLGGHLRPIEQGWTGIGPICAAAAVQPYLIPMAALPALAPDLARVRTAPKQVAIKFAVAAGAVVAISLLLGYIGSGGKAGSSGFGYYAADLVTAFNPMRYSNWLHALGVTRGAIGGFGYLGVGALALVAAGAFIGLARRLRRRGQAGEAADVSATDDTPGAANRWPARWLFLSIGMLTVFAVLPHVRFLGHQLVDLSSLTRHVHSLTAVFRVNGRFVWPFLWLVLLLAAAGVLRAGRLLAPCVIGLALVLQLGDVARPGSPLRPEPQVEYEAARHALLAQRADGATSVQFQPPVVIPGCNNLDFGPQFERLGDVLLASAVLRLPVNSGYTARLVPAFVRINCRAQPAAYAAGDYDPSVVYVLPASGTTVPAGLTCTQITREMLGCRAVRTR